MTRYQLTELAQSDLLEIRDLLVVNKDRDLALKILTELRDKIELLVDFPAMGRERPEFKEGKLIFFPFYSWLIIYNPKSKPLLVIRVVSAYRDLEIFL